MSLRPGHWGSTRRRTEGMESCGWRMVIEVYDFRGDAEWAQASIVK